MIFRLLAVIFYLVSFAFAEEHKIKSSIVKKLGPYSFEVDYIPAEDFDKLIEKIEYFKGPDLERHSKNINDYKNQYYRYLAYGAKSHLIKGGRRPASVNQDSNQKKLKFTFPVDQHLSLIAFKTGELEASCSEVVKKAKLWGTKTIAYYHPVHYSGGNGKTYKMPSKPVYGKHWRYELANHFRQNEFENCLDKIADAGLRLHYIPHLESIVTLNGEEEWRLLSGIPIDDKYFHYSFGPLLSYLKNKNKFKKNGSIDITLAAEIDPMVFSGAAELIKGKYWLKDMLSKFGVNGSQYFINTNGDFYHGHDLPQVEKTNCLALGVLLKDIDAFTPSMYGDKGHLKKNNNGNLDLKLTISSYRETFIKRIDQLCSQEKTLTSIKEVISQKKIGFGEFALDAKDLSQKYGDILRSSDKDLIFVQYWNHGEWDHLGLIGEESTRFKKELLKPRN